ncbi:hypothetical protein [Kitasatospora sp. NBC_01266]|uniref:hypothetical protein n=1 Tax=Kitasatospora sp. NBC_01266 TaxID=2903572 RepID=UPI002E2F2416|nr:hypothetical protein [Kitasatospora sp. NBC_01266]
MSAALLPSWPRINLQIALNIGGLQAGQPYWTDVTARLQGNWTAELSGRQYEQDAVQSGSATFILDNTDGSFDSGNASGPYYGSIKPYRQIRLTATWPPSANQLPQGLADGSALTDCQTTLGSVAIAAVSGAPSGQSTAIAWTYPASSAIAGAIGQGTGAPFPSCDQDATPVIGQPSQAPGQPWTASLYVSGAAGNNAGVQVNARLSWYNQAGARVATSDGAAVTVPTLPSWTRASVSATAPTGAVWARVELLDTTATTSSTTVYATGWQLEQSAAASTWTDPGTTYGLWQGYVERWQQKWDGAVRGTVTLGCVDTLAALAKLTLQPSFQQQLQALGPQFVYALNEASGATQFADQLGLNPPRLTYSPPSLGAGGGSVTAGSSVQGGGSVGSSGPVVTLSNPSWGLNGTTTAGVLLAAQSGANLPPVSGGLTRIICYRTTSVPTAGGAMCLWAATGPGVYGGSGSRAWLGIYLDPNQHLYAVVSDPTGTYTSTITVPDVAACDGNWHIGAIQLSSDGKTFTVANDTHGYQNVLPSGAYTLTGCNADTIGAMANPFVNSWQQYFQGDLAYAVQYAYPIGNSAAFDLGAGFATGWAGESSTARGQRILTMAGYTGQLTALGTQETMGGANLAGVGALAALATVADTEAGQVYTDGSGAVTLAGRRWRYLQSIPVVTFGEHTGEAPYGGGAEIDLDPDHVYNQISITTQVAPNSPQPPDVYAGASTSQQEYFQATLSRTINPASVSEAGYAAQYLAQQYAEPQPRVDAVSVDPSADPSLWPSVLGLGFGSRARHMRRPNNAAVIQLETFIEQLVWAGDDIGKLALTVQQSPAAPFTDWLIAAALHTTLATAATAGTNTVTLAPLTGSANNPASAVLVPGTVLTLGYGTADAENLTVKSVAATTAGYTSVGVTFSTNTVNNHLVGETVCQPLPSGYQLPAATAAGFPASLDPGATLSTSGPRAAY